jgi:hypothetical protein
MIFWFCREFRLLIAPLPNRVLTGLIGAGASPQTNAVPTELSAGLPDRSSFELGRDATWQLKTQYTTQEESKREHIGQRPVMSP